MKGWGGEKLREGDEGGAMSDEGQMHIVEMPTIEHDPKETFHVSHLGVAGVFIMEAEALKWKRRAERWKKRAKYEYADHGITVRMVERLWEQNDLLSALVEALTAEAAQKGKS